MSRIHFQAIKEKDKTKKLQRKNWVIMTSYTVITGNQKDDVGEEQQFLSE